MVAVPVSQWGGVHKVSPYNYFERARRPVDNPRSESPSRTSTASRSR